MKKSSMFHLLCGGAALALLTGCQCGAPAEPPLETTVVSRAKFPVKFDGELKDAAWSQTPAYELNFLPPEGLPPRETALVSKDKYESSVVKLLYDENYLYVGCALEDSDVVNTFTVNQEMLLRGGDLFEFFIAPAGTNPTCYWEFYATPNGLRSSFFYPSRGMVGVTTIWDVDDKYLVPGFAVKTRVNGTFNNPKDRDQSWTVEMRIPLKELEEKSGMKFAPGSRWRIQAARYNFGQWLNRVQNSVYPKMPCLNYHLVEYFSPVEFR